MTHLRPLPYFSRLFSILFNSWENACGDNSVSTAEIVINLYKVASIIVSLLRSFGFEDREVYTLQGQCYGLLQSL